MKAQGAYGQEFQGYLAEVKATLEDPGVSKADKAALLVKRGKTLTWKKLYPEADSILALAWYYDLQNEENVAYYRGIANHDHFFKIKEKNPNYYNSIERLKAMELLEMALETSDADKKKLARTKLQEVEKQTQNDLFEMLSSNPNFPKTDNNLGVAADLVDRYLKHYPKAFPYEWKNRRKELNEDLRNIYLSIANGYKNLMNDKKDETHIISMGGKQYEASKAVQYYREAMNYADKALALDIYNLKVKNFISGLKSNYEQIESSKKSMQLEVQGKKLEESGKELSSVKSELQRERMILDSLAASKDQLMAEVEEQKAVLAETEQQMETYRKELGQSVVLLENQKLISFITAFVAILISVLLIISVIGFRKLRVQNRIIEKNRNEIHEQHREITDSIIYAQRIQSAIMPPMKLIRNHLENSFIFYEPKDVIAGDFYWMIPKGKDGSTIFAAADCTGHGVPGAMVSVVCNSALNRSVKEFGFTEPGDILTKTRELVIEEFEKSDEVVRDGMDIALCSLKGRQLKYAGANNPLYLIRKGAKEVEIISAHKQAIGLAQKLDPFPTHTIQLEEGDTLYIFSDGYVDQFGGEKGKKLKATLFRELLLSIQDQSMEEQQESVVNHFFKWKGSYDQVDDVCVIGVRI